MIQWLAENICPGNSEIKDKLNAANDLNDLWYKINNQIEDQLLKKRKYKA